MKEQWVTITLEVPLKAIDFSDCGDGCGQVDGLAYAKFKGVKIDRFASDDVPAAEQAMHDWLGSSAPMHSSYTSDRQADIQRFAAQEQARVMNDPLSKAKDLHHQL